MLQSIALPLVVVAAQLVTAWPQPPQRAHLLERHQIRDEYDYIIVGGGTAGLTVGDRLTEDGNCVFSTKQSITIWLKALTMA
jgi:hypothetical protein